MPRKPKQNYHQLNGRPHAGLSDPARFGLTYDEVVALIDKGEWRKFYAKFMQRQRRGRTCSNCREKKQVTFETGKILLCKDCHELLEEIDNATAIPRPVQ